MSSISLVRYDAACRALAKARSVDEVKDIRDKAIAIKAYAKQAKNKNLEADAFEIRKCAERRLGEMIEAEEKALGARAPGVGKRGSPPDPRSLAAQGIDKNLADRVRRAHAMPREVRMGKRGFYVGRGAALSRLRTSATRRLP